MYEKVVVLIDLRSYPSSALIQEVLLSYCGRTPRNWELGWRPMGKRLLLLDTIVQVEISTVRSNSRKTSSPKVTEAEP